MDNLFFVIISQYIIKTVVLNICFQQAICIHFSILTSVCIPGFILLFILSGIVRLNPNTQYTSGRPCLCLHKYSNILTWSPNVCVCHETVHVDLILFF